MISEARPNRTLGPPHDRFWAHCAEDALYIQRCAQCCEFAWPPVRACENCGSADLAYAPTSGKGKIISWATFERDYYGGALPIPWDTILVQLEEGPLFVSNPSGFSWPEIVIDMPVFVTFISARDDAGEFRLPVFAKDLSRSAELVSD